jgi:hypothetical protein
MNYKIEQNPSEPIVLVTLFESFDFVLDFNEAIRELTAIFDAQSSPVFYACDVRSIKVGFGDMVGLMALQTKGSTAFLKHPNIHELVLITSSDLLTFGGKALGQKQYGGLSVSIFGSPEEAFDYMRERSTSH